MSVVITALNELLPTRFTKERVSELVDYEYISGDLDLDENSPFYPNRSDLKIMRRDVVASIVLLNQLIESYGKPQDLSEYGLYVASGVFIERSEAHLNHLMQIFEEYERTPDRAERMRKLYRASPPLLALQTLTNSSMSFIAQYTGVCGNNATFGTSSSGAAHAIQRAFFDASFDGKKSIVCASNCAGPTSFFMNLPFRGYSSGWTESAASASMILEPRTTNRPILATIHEVQFFSAWEELTRSELFRSNSNFLISGSYTEQQHQQVTAQFAAHSKHVLNAFDSSGNLGPVNLIHLLISLVRGSVTSHVKSAVIIDQDVYNQWSCLQIQIP